MKSRIYAAVFIALGLAGVNSSAYAMSVKPGLWRYTTVATLNGKTVPAGEPENECISPQDASRDLSAAVRKSVEQEQPDCKVTEWNSTGASFKGSMSCKGGAATGTAQVVGSVSETEYSVKFNSQGMTREGVAYKASNISIGKWIGPCK